MADVPSQPEPGDTEVETGPVQLPSQYGGLLDSRGFDEVPTPPSGFGPPAPWPRAMAPVVPPVSPPVPPPAVPPLAGPPGKPPLGALRTERESVVALFLVHMFPIGHLPVATDRPARQLPLPGDAVAAGPFEHPDAELLDDASAYENVRAGFRRSATVPSAAAPPELSEDYEPATGVEDQGWPPGALFPDGGLDAAEPVILPEGALLDRFGGAEGRVFAVDGTPFARRSLPPSALDAGYRRYRVTRPVPMWRSVSAEWFGQPGGGTRLRAVLSADELVTLGFLADITGETR
ncbi:TNT domain-containing protein [Amycolatopsis sp. NPDC059027]|uniref:TNT domain-containing protein n=1 Tax=unclassified Amycolatopsis TaxID=2618356 RepID=UPI003672D6FE